MVSGAEPRQGLILRFLRWPLVRVCVLTALLFYLYLSGHLFRGAFAHGAFADLAVVFWMIAITATVYVAFVHIVEQRKASELSTPGMGRELALGAFMGAGTYTLCVVILMVLGVYRIDGFNSPYVLLGALWFAVSSGFFEELYFRGVVFRVTEEVFGTWAGVIVSSLVFGLVHLNNSGSTLQGALFIAIETGPLLAASYILTGRLWMGIGWHSAWNYTQSAVFSGINSGGDPPKGFVKAIIQGPDVLTGGSFGMESSIVAFALCATTGFVMLVMAYRRGKIVPPRWERAA